MSKLLVDEYEKYTGISFHDAFVKRKIAEERRRRCAYCGAKNPFTKDHVVPRSRGGSDNKTNLVWCCMSCNSKKRAKTPLEANMPILYPEASKVK